MQHDIRFFPAEWSPQVQAVMNAASGLNAAYTVEDLRREVSRGASKLMQVVQVMQDGSPMLLGYLCFWKEPQGQGQELVIHAGAALTDERKTFAKVAPHIKRLALENGCQSIRAHTASSKRLAMFKANGYQMVEFVVRQWV